MTTMSDSSSSPEKAVPGNPAPIMTGIRRGLPIFLGYVPLGFAYGVLAVQNGIPPIPAVLMSLFVYAGAGQFIAVGLCGAGAPVLTIVFTTLIVNLRHLLMSAALAPWLAPFARIHQWFIGWGLTDEVFATHSSAMNAGERASLPLVYAANFTAHSGWILGSLLGAVARDFLPDPKFLGLDFALPAMFMALLAPLCRDRLRIFIAALAAVLSVMLVLAGAGRWNVILATLISATVGTLLVQRRDSQSAKRKNA